MIYSSAPQYPVQPPFGRPLMQFNPEANFFPRGAHYRPMPFYPGVPNGAAMSRSVSQVSSQAAYMQDRPESRGGVMDGRIVSSTFTPTHANGAMSTQNGLSDALIPADGQATEVDSTHMLRDFLLQQIGNPQYADFIIEVMNGRSPMPVVSLPLHRVLISRSPTLAAAAPHGIIQYSPDKFFHSGAFIGALKFLYGAPLLSIQSRSSESPSFDNMEPATPSKSTTNMQNKMAYALGYASAGFFLQLTMIIVAGLQCARRVLNWENVQTAIAFSFHAGGSAATAREVQAFFQDVLKFMVTHLPTDFTFLDKVPQILEFQRLPMAGEPLPSVPDQRLSGLMFGSLTFDPDPPAVDADSAKFSSILVTLPFAVLEQVLQDPALVEKLGASKVVDLARAVIAEREKRRNKAAKAKGIRSSAELRLADSVNWQESFHQGENNSFSLSRTRIDTPKSGTSEVAEHQAPVPTSG